MLEVLEVRRLYLENRSQFLVDRLRDLLSTNAEMTPLEVAQRLYIIYDETIGQR